MLIDGSEEDIATLATLHRTLLAALIAPSATGVVLIEIEALAVGDLVGGVGAHFWLLVGCYVLSYTIGLPLYLVARRRGWRNCAAYVTGAFAMGMAAFPILIAIMALSAPGTNNLASAFGVDSSDWLFGLSATGILATPIGLLFWLITRPDRSA